MKRFLIPLLAAIALPNSVHANAEYDFTYCVNNRIEKAAKDNKYVNARELQRTCACYANNRQQNLSVWSCPEYKTIPRYEIDRYFE